MFAKLDGLYDRYRELSEAIAQPEIIQDQGPKTTIR